MASKMAYLYSNDTRGISFNPNRGHMGITKTLTLVLVKILLGHVLRRMSVTSFSPVLTANRPNMITVNVQAYFAPCLSLLGHERTCPQILLGDYQLFEATQLSWWQSIVSPKGFIWVYSTHLSLYSLYGGTSLYGYCWQNSWNVAQLGVESRLVIHKSFLARII